MRRGTSWILVTIAAIVAGGCGNRDRPDEVAASLKALLTTRTPAVEPAVWGDVQDAYGRRDDQPAWITDGMVRVREALTVLQSAGDDGLAAADYGADEIARRLEVVEQDSSSPDRPQQLAQLDALVMQRLLQFGRDLALGRTDPRAIDPRWNARREAPDFVGHLAQTTASGLTTWREAIRPRHPEYAALRGALATLRMQQRQGGWPTVPEGPFSLGRSHPSVALLRARLVASGDLAPASGGEPPVFDADLATAIKGFQERHGLRTTGAVDTLTLSALNVPVDARIQQVELNLDRWRWLPDDLGSRHLIVNIPAYRLMARDGGRPVLDMRVVVGTPDRETPVFSGDMKTLVFSPYWNVPESIAEGETAPAAAQDPSFLRRNNIEILRLSRSGPQPVNPASVDWDDPESLNGLVFRQRPGPNNALGHVKFLFPNPYDVYLHDTPADELFARNGRALSHGCVRVEDPEALAAYVLRDLPEWDAPRMRDAMHAGVEKHVALKSTIPVHLVYLTAWVDDAGRVHFSPDIYGHDATQASHVATATGDVPVRD